LRLSILLGEIEPMKVPDLTPNQLAPRRLQELQEQQKQKFFQD
jgi:hypothetical protein